MFRQIVFTTLITLSLGATKFNFKHIRHAPDGRIVGGNDADILDYPHQISLLWQSQHICGGSIISENYVVTAAHCTDGSSASELSIRVNSSIVEEGGKVINVKKINQNPKYDSSATDFDISVLELESPLQLGPGVNIIGLPKENVVLPDGTTVSVTGWGVLKETDYDLSKQLQVVQVNIVNSAECQKDYSTEYISPRMICAGVPQGGKDSCQGDSGGPLIADGILYGIVSWGYGCAEKGYPGVYASVSALRSYITEITGL